MATIQWRPEINALTTPQSYWIRFMPRNVASREDIAADIALRHPNFSAADILTILKAEDEAVQARLINGEQVTKSGAFSYSLTFSGRLNSPDEPLPPLDRCLQVNVRVSPPFVEAVRQAAQTERLPEEKKLPLISVAEDMVLGLKDALNPEGMLRLAGKDMRFDRSRPDEGCVIENTAGGKTAQTRFGKIEDSEILVMPDLPAPPQPWNNEYTVSVSTRYSGHGTLRTGTYARKLRSPLTVYGLDSWTGILTGNAAAAHVSVTGGTASAAAVLRIQAVLDLQGERLLFSLLDMREGGAAGAAVSVTQNGAYILPGYAGSPVSSMEVTVNSYAALREMIRNDYGGRVADVLDVRAA